MGICLYVSVAPQGQKNEKLLPFPTAFLYGSYSFAPSGRFYCCTFVRRALPWADVSLPLRGVGGLTFRRICYPPELVPTPNPILRQAKRLRRLPQGRGWGWVSAPSLWEGWGGLLFVYRITYPYTLCRRIAYPPELVPTPVSILRQAKQLRRLPELSSPARTLFACMSKNP